jgi:dTDP-4-amino-4,6-dideoxygalactose transaminase
MTTDTGSGRGVHVGIPFNRPSLEGRETEYMRLAVEEGHTSAAGPFSSRASELLRDELGVADVLLTTSCTAALEMSAMLLDIGPGDTVVVPSFGFVTTALAFVRQGARIRFCDIEDQRLGLDPEHLDRLMDETVRAVVPIHYAGVPCDLEGVSAVLSGWPRAVLVEDNAHGLFGRHRRRPLGSFGRFATLSFHETKNFICGEGGALLLNDPADVSRAHTVYHKGTNRREFMLGEVDKYSWQDVGSSFGLSDVLAAFLFGQLEARESIQSRRRRSFEHYRELLEPVSDRFGLRLPVVPEDCEPAHHMFYVLLPDRDMRNQVLAQVQGAGVHATFHYVPLHSSPGGQRFSAGSTDCPVTDDVSGRLLRLPFYTSLSEHERTRAVDVLVSALERAAG